MNHLNKPLPNTDPMKVLRAGLRKMDWESTPNGELMLDIQDPNIWRKLYTDPHILSKLPRDVKGVPWSVGRYIGEELGVGRIVVAGMTIWRRHVDVEVM